MTGHIHAAMMLQYAKDAAETDTPWERWQCAIVTYHSDYRQWLQCVCHPEWQLHMAYRRRPRTVRIGYRDVPESMRVHPELNTRFYVPNLGVYSPTSPPVLSHLWRGDDMDLFAFRLGLCYATEEDARARLDAEMALAPQAENQP